MYGSQFSIPKANIRVSGSCNKIRTKKYDADDEYETCMNEIEKAIAVENLM